MNLRKFTLLIFLLTTIALSAFSQADTIGLKTIIAKTAKLAYEHPIEKVYLHFDKPYYAVGDTIWFKAYVTVELHQPSTLSKIVYVDVISNKDSVVQTLKLQVTSGIAFGNISLLSPLYKQGNYHIRAYTNWMRNTDPDYFFNKTIAIGSFEKQIITNILLAGSVKNNLSKVNARVFYKDPNGKAYPNKRVSWKVLNDDETISKGKGVTDINGLLNIAISTNKTSAINSSDLVTVIDVTDSKSITNSFSLKHALDEMDVQFFPEGGLLVNDVTSKVAFKAIKPDGLGIDIKGTITDNTGTVITDFSSQHLGMGVFMLTPQNGKTYKANIAFADGTQNTYNLPKAQDEGIAFAANNILPENLGIQISANNTFFQKNKSKKFYIVAQNGEKICYAAQIILQNQVYSALIPKATFPTGILKLTIFSEYGEALNERIVFIQRNDQLNITLNTAQQSYAPMQKVIMNVLAKQGDQPVQANLSATVIDETKVPFDENAETTILTSLLLTSDLKGYVEKPNYYFNHADNSTAANLDILMLTQGYSRFLYKDILADRYPSNKFLPEQGIDISGTLRTASGMPVSKGSVNLSIPDRKISLSMVTGLSGEFNFSKLMLPDSTRVSINAKGNYGSSNLMIMVDGTSFQRITTNVTAPDGIANIDSLLNPYLQNSKQQFTNSHVLKEVVIKSTSTEKQPSHVDYPSLSGLNPQSDQFIPGDKFSDCTSLAICLSTAVFGVVYDNNNFYIRKDYQNGNKKPVEIYLNGNAIEYNDLKNILPADVQSVEVFLTDGLSGINSMTGTNGLLVINTKQPKKMSRTEIAALLAPQNSVVNFIAKGYSPARMFYSPKYDVVKTANMGGDLRSTIYWKPNIITDKNGVSSFDFFNAGSKGTYRAIIEGIDMNGNIGRYVYHYKVE
jgi:hypothetical protein